MSVCASIYFEYKKDGDLEWHLLEALIPRCAIRDQSWDYVPCADDNQKVEIGGTEFGRIFNYGTIGYVRDLLCDHSIYGFDPELGGRGFPEDLSPELKEIFDATQKEIDSRKSQEPWYSDWRGGKSWCYLSEIQEYVDKRFEKWKTNVLSQHARFLTSNVISQKLDEILAAVSGECYEQKHDEAPDDYDDGQNMVEYYMEEELEELKALNGFVDAVMLLCDFLTGIDSDKFIRLVFYHC